MGDICLGCGEEPESVGHHWGDYTVCGKCHAQGCDLYRRGNVWYFIRKDGDVERAKRREEDIQKYPMVGEDDSCAD